MKDRPDWWRPAGGGFRSPSMARILFLIPSSRAGESVLLGRHIGRVEHDPHRTDDPRSGGASPRAGRCDPRGDGTRRGDRRRPVARGHRRGHIGAGLGGTPPRAGAAGTADQGDPIERDRRHGSPRCPQRAAQAPAGHRPRLPGADDRRDRGTPRQGAGRRGATLGSLAPGHGRDRPVPEAGAGHHLAPSQEGAPRRRGGDRAEGRLRGDRRGGQGVCLRYGSAQPGPRDRAGGDGGGRRGPAEARRAGRGDPEARPADRALPAGIDRGRRRDRSGAPAHRRGPNRRDGRAGRPPCARRGLDRPRRADRGAAPGDAEGRRIDPRAPAPGCRAASQGAPARRGRRQTGRFAGASEPGPRRGHLGRPCRRSRRRRTAARAGPVEGRAGPGHDRAGPRRAGLLPSRTTRAAPGDGAAPVGGSARRVRVPAAGARVRPVVVGARGSEPGPGPRATGRVRRDGRGGRRVGVRPGPALPGRRPAAPPARPAAAGGPAADVADRRAGQCALGRPRRMPAAARRARGREPAYRGLLRPERPGRQHDGPRPPRPGAARPRLGPGCLRPAASRLAGLARRPGQGDGRLLGRPGPGRG